MTNPPLVSFARRFAYMAALLASLAMLVIGATSWWLINQQHAASLRSLMKKDAELHAATVGNHLNAVATRMSEITKEGLIANALFDNADKERLLIPYLNSLRSIRGISVDILFTDFQGREIASNTNGKGNFNQQDLSWLKEKFPAGQPVSRVQLGEQGEELIAAEFIVLSRSNSVDGALVYKIKLASLDLHKDVRVVHGKESKQLSYSQATRLVALDVPPIYKNLDFAIFTSPNPAASWSDWQSLGGFLILAVGMVVGVIILGQYFANRLVKDLLELQVFARDVSVTGFGTVRAEGGDSLEVASLAQSINRMLDHLKQQHDKLSESEERFRSLFEYSEVGMYVRDADSKYLEVNPAFVRMLGYSKEELLRISFREITHPDDVESSLAKVKTLLTGECDHLQMEKKFIRKDGSILWTDVTVSAVRDDARNLISFIGVAQDITGRKQAQDEILRLNASLEERVQQRTVQLEASTRDLQEFAYSVAHDLRQPFIAIGGFSGLLERTVTDERASHYVKRIKAGVRQAGELTDALLALANLSRVQLHLQVVDISAIAHSVMGALQHQDPARLASVSIQDGLMVQADPVLIKLVMQELLGNAWKFTSRRSHAKISFGMLPAQAGTLGDDPVYVVRDNGEGFDMVHADKLFRSFQRLHIAQDFPGSGAGLANIRRIVARHNGQVWAESAVGEGASFFFTLGNAQP